LLTGSIGGSILSVKLAAASSRPNATRCARVAGSPITGRKTSRAMKLVLHVYMRVRAHRQGGKLQAGARTAPTGRDG